MKSITLLTIVLFSFFSQAQDQEIKNRIYSLISVKGKQSPKEFPMDNDINYLQIENGEAVINYRSRGKVTFYQGLVQNYTTTKTETGEKTSFYLAPSGLGSKTINFEIFALENGQYQINLFDKLGSLDVFLLAELSNRDIFKE
ncbi:hypothetical protein [Fluviicola sp.]|jgi:hypothetical protein|uniref:hypothetical protein n=1 Tax=Fluviicola sp. TaxID=1917219 RepID=UPI0026396DD6|nr:hypothetical protein [Fluviicola sp.]